MKSKKACVFLSCILLLVSLLAGCGQAERKVVIGGNGLSLPPISEKEIEEEASTISEQGLYIYVKTNETTQSMLFIKLAESRREAEINYYGGTCIYNRFGESITMDKLKPGTIFTLELDEMGSTIKAMKESDKVWTFENVENYVLDADSNRMIIGGENYYMEEMVPVFDGKDYLSRRQITDSDVLTLVGYGRTLLSVQISTAHGELAFKNIKDLEGGYFVLGNVAAAQIRKGASLSVRAGQFLLSVAGAGRSGSKNITIKPGKKTTVDLSKFVSAEKRSAQVTFALAQENTKVLINGKEINPAEPLTLAYGVYRIEASLEGYNTWVRTLFLNSPKALIRIELTQGNGSSNTNQSTQNNQNQAGSLAGSLAGGTDNSNQNNGGTTTNNQTQTGENTLKESLINDVMNLITGN